MAERADHQGWTGRGIARCSPQGAARTSLFAELAALEVIQRAGSVGPAVLGTARVARRTGVAERAHSIGPVELDRSLEFRSWFVTCLYSGP